MCESVSMSRVYLLYQPRIAFRIFVFPPNIEILDFFEVLLQGIKFVLGFNAQKGTPQQRKGRQPP